MFFRKMQKELDKEIINGGTDESADGVIKVRVTSREQIYSSYSYSGDKLNPEFYGYIYEKAKNVSVKDELTVKIYTEEHLDADDVGRTLKSHYRQEYREAKRDVKRVSSISLVMAVLGVITLGILVMLNHVWDNFYVTTVVEIASWVFVWEAVDYFFLQRPVIKARLILIQRLYCGKTEICEGSPVEFAVGKG